jgi:hypothetical protein
MIIAELMATIERVGNDARRFGFRLGAFGVRGYASRSGHGKSQEISVEMIIGLSRTRRLKAGWVVALSYLLCVLAPTLSFALPGSHAVTPCLSEAAHGPGIVHMDMDTPIQQIRIDDHVHDHANVHSYPSSGDQDRSMALNGKSVPEKAPHSPGEQCCGLTCVTALPAMLTDIVKPTGPMVLCGVEGYRKISDNGPPRLYRPPIS